MAYLATGTFHILNKNGKVTKSFKPGDTVETRYYMSLNDIKKNKCVYVNPNPEGKVRWVRSEIEQVIELYVNNPVEEWVTEQFQTLYPNQQHPEGSIQTTVRQLKTLDINFPNDTEWKVTELVAEVATEMYPERFFSSAKEAKDYLLEMKANEVLKELIG